MAKKALNKSENKVENKAENKAENRAENKAENRVENKAENRAENKAGKKSVVAAKNGVKAGSFAEWLKKNLITIIVLIASLGIFLGFFFYANSDKDEDDGVRASYTVYERGTVLEVTGDTLEKQPMYEDNYVGEQSLIVKFTTGQFEGQEMEATNYMSALYGTKLDKGDGVVLCVSIADGEIINVVVYEYDKTVPILIMLAIFIAVTVLVGGRRGAQSLLGLVLTIVAIIWILLPLLMKGFPTIITTFVMCVLLAVVCFTLLGGVTKKTICAMIGTACGMGIAVLFGLLAQNLCQVDGMRMSDYIDALLQLRMGGYPLKLKGLLIGGTIISAMGAVMDVAMSISSATCELISVNPNLTRKDLWKSGMNIGKDMIGTMTNTLILAFVGSSFIMVLYIYTMNIPFYELFSSNLVATEFVHAIASSIGVILSVPLTVFVSMLLHRKK